MSQKREFPIAVILTVTTGRLLCDMGEVYDILRDVERDTREQQYASAAHRFTRVEAFSAGGVCVCTAHKPQVPGISHGGWARSSEISSEPRQAA